MTLLEICVNIYKSTTLSDEFRKKKKNDYFNNEQLQKENNHRRGKQSMGGT